MKYLVFTKQVVNKEGGKFDWNFTHVNDHLVVVKFARETTVDPNLWVKPHEHAKCIVIETQSHKPSEDIIEDGNGRLVLWLRQGDFTASNTEAMALYAFQSKERQKQVEDILSSKPERRGQQKLAEGEKLPF